MIHPVELVIAQDHPYKAKPKPPGKTTRPPGCKFCGAAKLSRAHLATPSLNDPAALDRHLFNALKAAWQLVFSEELVASGLPRDTLGAVTVEGRIGFPTLIERDEGNFRWMIEKALGDALVLGFWKLRKIPKTPDPAEVTQPSKKEDHEYLQVVAGGWLPKDTFFPTRRYSFGNLEAEYTPKESSLNLTLFPSTPRPCPGTPTPALPKQDGRQEKTEPML